MRSNWHLVLLRFPVSMPREERKRQRQMQRVQGSQQSRRRLPASLLEILEGATTPIGKNKRNRLTVSDWMRGYAYMDTLGSQLIKQWEVVDVPARHLLFVRRW